MKLGKQSFIRKNVLTWKKLWKSLRQREEITVHKYYASLDKIVSHFRNNSEVMIHIYTNN